MKIAHVTATFPPYHGGTGVVCYHNALGLARLGHEVTVYTADEALNDYRYPSEIAVHHLPVLFRLGNAPLLPSLWNLAGFDVVHLHYPFYFGAEMLFFKSLLGGSPYVVTYHQDVLFDGWLRFPERFHHALLGRQILGRAAKVLATSQDYARASRLGTLARARPGLVDELPNGVDARRFHPGVEGSAVRDHYHLPPEDRTVLFVGALDRAHYFKGIDVLLQALCRISDPGLRLLVVGDGDLRATYQSQALDLGLAARVTFCGQVPDADLPAHYAASDLLVLPSTTMGEAFGVVLLEAMACGKPVIASNLPGVRSVVNDGQDGLLVRPGDAADLAQKLQRLLADAPGRREMGVRGRKKVEERYDWPRIVPRLEEIYAEVLTASPAPRGGLP
ncbi:MAG TPA: glycosyltransferase family 4 protein [Anaerolineae bacterium]|nr:glycosyltransferase family 4 protein [Anaerolineae bacterium]